MKYITFMLSLFLLGVTPLAALSDNWILFHKHKFGNYYYDAESIKKTSSSEINLWTKQIYNDAGRRDYIQKRRDSGSTIDGYQNLKEVKGLFDLNCEERKIRNLIIEEYTKRGNLLYSFETVHPWGNIASGSIGEVLLNAVCDNKSDVNNTSSVASNGKQHVYRDRERGFVLHYPATWSQVSSTHANTRIKIVKENRVQDCMVNVQTGKVPRNLTADEFAKSAPTISEYEQLMKKVLPDMKIFKRERTFLSNQAAISYIYDSTFRSPGLEIPMRGIIIQTVKNGYIYSVSCRALRDEFEEHFTEFQLIFAGFLIWPIQ